MDYTIRHLTLRCASSEDYDLFFRQVNLPALESLLRPDRRVTNFTWPSTNFLDILRCSTPTSLVQSYARRADSGCRPSMFDFLKLCPDLEVLQVNLNDGDFLFASLRKLADAGIRFPKLEDVVIRTAGITQETEEGKAKCAILEELIGRITAKVR
ncbi:hypothetical protein VNI00_014529 [Paramarasmius palmivorus]|uniref:Uncharacterized protein n=1 Tax=Paramarasmius palmivorus TaxID=297713 RepID=A0AAW0BTH9_9AGAR